MKPDVDTLTKSTSKGKNKRKNILNILNNIKSSVFDGLYFGYHDKSESKSEESIAERPKLGRQRFDEIDKKEKMISLELFKTYFGNSSRSDMYKTSNEATGSGETQAQVNTIENRLANLMEVLKSKPTSGATKIKNRNNMLENAELILYFNQLNQAEKSLKILIPNQMLSRLLITLAQSRAGNNSKKLKNEIRQILCSLYRTKILTKTIYNNLINIV